MLKIQVYRQNSLSTNFRESVKTFSLQTLCYCLKNPKVCTCLWHILPLCTQIRQL